MPLSSGTLVGSYKVVALIGAGGMGEVYRAHDTRLNRDVALKVLPEAFCRDGQRMARFEREARLLASLNHPNIAAIYGLEESGAIRALVMELVEGPTLADRVAAGPLPLEEVLPIARQVADAVEYAHDQNVIHRDLKPANIKVTTEGAVKVLDFGLAKALANEPAEADMGNSPTLSMAATVQGVILGTAAYMSPEQARGRRVDRRADVWAFGCTLYELLTAKRVFAGEDVSETLALVMTKEAALDALPANTPPAIRNLLRRCLERNLKRRLQNMGEARIVIEDVVSGAVSADVVAAPRQGFLKNARAAWAVAAGTFVLAALGWGAFAYFRSAPEQPAAMRFFVSPPETWSLLQVAGPGGSSPAPLAISPDGRRLAFAAVGQDGKSFLWVRSLDALTAQMIAGTEGAAQPFWSPDSRFLAFHAGEKLKRIDLSGGPPITLCDAPAGQGGAWSRDDVILFASNLASSPIFRVPASGGAPIAATTIGEGEPGHGRPTFLPDGRHFLYRSGVGGMGASIYLASLDSSERQLLLRADGTPVVYSAGHLLFLRERTLMAQPFDPRRLELAGEAFPIAEEVQTHGANPNAVFSASENGVLAYQTGTGGAISRLLWFDRSGKQTGSLGEPGGYFSLALSPDGSRVSVSILEANNRDIWVFDVARGLRSRLTFDSAIETESIWSPDGTRLIFNSNRKGRLDLYHRAADGSGTEEVLLEDTVGNKNPTSWSTDGRFILYASGGIATGLDLYALPLSGNPAAGSGQVQKPVPLIQGQFNQTQGQLSPDGRWVAYRSDESGRNEIYVAPYPGPGGKRQVSTAGGASPRWRRDGTEIFYLAPDSKLMAAEVNGKGAAFQVGLVRPLFQTRAAAVVLQPYDVTADGQRFLINTLPEQQAASVPMTVVVNWAAGLRK